MSNPNLNNYTSKKQMYLILLLAVIGAVGYAALRMVVFYPRAVSFGCGIIHFSVEPNRGPDTLRLAINKDDPIIADIESWINHRTWTISYVSYLPKQQLSSEKTRLIRVGNVVVLCIKNRKGSIWKQYTRVGDEQIFGYFNELQTRYDSDGNAIFGRERKDNDF